MPWATPEQVTAALGAVLRKDLAGGMAAAEWGEIVAEATAAAKGDVLSALLGRGYDPAQVDGWDQLLTYHRDLALYWALTKGGGVKVEEFAAVKALYRRKDLATVLLLINGVPVAPGQPAGSGGGASGGRLSEAGYRFTMLTEF